MSPRKYFLPCTGSLLPRNVKCPRTVNRNVYARRAGERTRASPRGCPSYVFLKIFTSPGMERVFSATRATIRLTFRGSSEPVQGKKYLRGDTEHYHHFTSLVNVVLNKMACACDEENPKGLKNRFMPQAGSPPGDCISRQQKGKLGSINNICICVLIGSWSAVMFQYPL